MARITSVDYENIPNTAKTIRTQGQELNNEIITAYTSIANMHNSWYGKRYNSLAVSFNQLAPQVNELLTLAVREIPFALETVANSYAVADIGEAARITPQQVDPKKVPLLATPNDVGMKFISNDVTGVQQKVSENFRNIENLMHQIQQQFEKINWESEAANVFKGKFSELSQKIIARFNEIMQLFNKLMSEALNEIQATENSIANNGL